MEDVGCCLFCWTANIYCSSVFERTGYLLVEGHGHHHVPRGFAHQVACPQKIHVYGSHLKGIKHGCYQLHGRRLSELSGLIGLPGIPYRMTTNRVDRTPSRVPNLALPSESYQMNEMFEFPRYSYMTISQRPGPWFCRNHCSASWNRWRTLSWLVIGVGLISVTLMKGSMRTRLI